MISSQLLLMPLSYEIKVADENQRLGSCFGFLDPDEIPGVIENLGPAGPSPDVFKVGLMKGEVEPNGIQTGIDDLFRSSRGHLTAIAGDGHIKVGRFGNPDHVAQLFVEQGFTPRMKGYQHWIEGADLIETSPKERE